MTSDFKDVFLQHLWKDSYIHKCHVGSLINLCCVTECHTLKWKMYYAPLENTASDIHRFSQMVSYGVMKIRLNVVYLGLTCIVNMSWTRPWSRKGWGRHGLYFWEADNSTRVGYQSVFLVASNSNTLAICNKEGIFKGVCWVAQRITR